MRPRATRCGRTQRATGRFLSASRPGPARRVISAVVSFALALGLALVSLGLDPVVPPAEAASVTCTPTSGFTGCTRITNNNALQTFTVPAGVTSIRARVWGAGGGGVDSAYYNVQTGGGAGGYTTAEIPVTPGQTLSVVVGQGGSAVARSTITGATGTYGGGAAGGNGSSAANSRIGGSSGGGYSGVFLGAVNQDNALVIAGGGGGSSPGADLPNPPYPASGGGGGLTGGAGPYPYLTGQGGTQTAGGAGATTDTGCTGPAAPGTALSGGRGSSASSGTSVGEGGGGGGGGWFGGGGGKCQGRDSTVTDQNNGNGGGGSGYLASTVSDGSSQAGGNGSGGSSTSGGATAGLPPNTTDAQYVQATASCSAASTTQANVCIGRGGTSNVTKSSGGGTAGNGLVVLEWDQGFTVSKVATPSVAKYGDVVTYRVQVTNTGTSDYTAAFPARFSDTLTDVSDDAVLGTATSSVPGWTFGSGSPLVASGPLPAGQTATITYAATVNSSATGNRRLVNRITPDADQFGSCESSAACTTTTPVYDPRIAIAKSASPAVVNGTSGSVTYTYSVTNPGNEPLAGVTLSDDKIASISQTHTGDTNSDNLLDPSETWVYTVTQTLTATTTNVGRISARGNFTNTAVQATSSATVTVNKPNINVVKTAGTPSAMDAGGYYTVPYTITVTNTGTLSGSYGPLTDTPAFANNLVPTSAAWTGQSAGSAGGTGPYTIGSSGTALAIGATHTYNVVLTFRYTNNTAASACGASGTGLYNSVALPGAQETGATADNAACATPPAPPSTGVTVDKSVSAATVNNSGTVTYTYTVRNPGTEPLKGVTLADDKIASLSQTHTGDADGDGLLDAGEAWVYTASQAISATVTNTATVTATGNATSVSVSDTDQATVTVVRPNLNVDKTGVSVTGPSAAGVYSATYTVRVTNTTSAPGSYGALSDSPAFAPNLSVTGATWTTSGAGAPAGGSATGGGPFTLAPAATAIAGNTTHSYAVTVTFRYTNATTAASCSGSGTGLYNAVALPSGQEGGGTGDNAACLAPPAAPNPGLSLTKSVASTSPATLTAAGQSVNYRFEVANSGNVSLYTPTINDARCSSAATLASGDTNSDGVLQVGETWIFTCAHTVTQAEVDARQVANSATATATGPGTAPITSAASATTTPVQPVAAVAVTKSVASTTPSPLTASNQSVRYSFAVTSGTGTISLGSVGVSDARCSTTPAYASGDTNGDGRLNPSETWVYTCTHTTTQAEVDGGSVVNTATATGTPIGGAAVSAASNTVTTPISPRGGVSLTKSVSGTSPNPLTAAGQTVNYSFSVGNGGNVTLSAIELSDARCDAAPVRTAGDNGDNLLQVGETWTYACAHTVTQTEVDAAQVVNAAVVTGRRPDNTTTSANASVTQAISPSTGIAVDKQVTSRTPDPITAAGNTVGYTFVLTNTGSRSLASPRINDQTTARCNAAPALASGDANADGLLQPTETWRYTCTHTVTQAEVDGGSVANTATATATPVGGGAAITSAPDTTVVPIANAGSLGLTKVVDSTNPATLTAAGQSISYRLNLTNGLNVTVTNPRIADALCDAAPAYLSGDTGAAGSLSPGEVWVFACTHTITQAEVDARQVINTAQASVTTPGGADASSPVASVARGITPVASLNLAKVVSGTVPATLTAAGQTVNYRFTATNPGTVSVRSLSVADSRCNVAAAYASGDSNGDSQLQPGETWTYTCSHTVTQAEADAGRVDNSATLTGTPLGGTAPISSAPATATVGVNAAGGVSLAKTVTSTAPATLTAAGQTITYGFTVGNSGTVTLAAVTLTDARCAAVPVRTGGDTNGDDQLQVGETWVYACTHVVTQAEVDARRVDNTAAVNATRPNGSVSTSTASATQPVSPTAAIEVDKQVASTSPSPLTGAGNTVSYRFVVTNPGTVSLSSVRINDSRCTASGAPTGDANNDGLLQPSETWVFACAVTVLASEADAGAVNNTATATGTPAGVTGTVTSPGDSTTVPVAAAPGLSLDKQVASTNPATLSAAGQSVNYRFVARNTGNVTLSSVVLTDARCASAPVLASGDTNGDAQVQTGETWVYTCTHTLTQAEVDARQVVNTAELGARTPAGAAVPVVRDTETVAIAPNAAIAVAKSVASTNPSPLTGAQDTVNYRFQVTNPGTISLTSPAIDDARCNARAAYASGDTNADGRLQPGETWVFGCAHTVTQAEADAGRVTNTAAASGTPMGATSPVTSASSGTTTTIAPAGTLAVDKEVANTSPAPLRAAGDTVTYRFTVTSTANVSVAQVAITDNRCSAPAAYASGDTNTDGLLQPTETWVFGCAHPLTQAEVDNRVVANSATARGTTPAGAILTSAPDTTTAPVQPTPAVAVAKSVASTSPSPLTAAGQSASYRFAVSNPGTVSLTSPAIDDAQCVAAPAYASGDTNSDSLLQPSETWIYTCAHTVTQAEVDRGRVDNTATVTAAPVGSGAAVSSSPASATVSITPTGGIAVAKSVASTNPSPLTAAGQTISYRLQVTNPGTASLAAVAIDDALCATEAPTRTGGDTNNDNLLQPSETWIYSCTHTLTQAETDARQVVNTAIASGLPLGQATRVTSSPASVSAPIAPTGGVTVDKQVAPSTPASIDTVGQNIDYLFVVGGTGTASLSGVTVTDARCSSAPALVSGDANSDGLLQPTELWTFACSHVVSQADLDAGSVTNTATARGTTGGVTSTSAPDSTTVPVTQAPGLTLAKTVTGTSPSPLSAAGQTVSYRFTVGNAGNVTVNSVQVSDARCAAAPGFVAGDTNSDGRLQVGETWIFDCVHTVTQAEVDARQVVNSASVTGRSPSGAAVTPATAGVTVGVQPSAAVAVTKSVASTAPSPLVGAGNTVTYAITVTNPGQVSLASVAVTDARCSAAPVYVSGDTGADGRLSPTEAWRYTCAHTVTQDEADAGRVDNTVGVNALPVGGGEAVSGTGSTSATIPVRGGISLTKAIASTEPSPLTGPNQRVNYTLTVANTGNVTLAGLALTDALCSTPVLVGGDANTDARLQVGETWVYTCTHTTTQAETDAGSVSNQATIQATRPDGSAVTSTDTTTRPIAGTTGIALDKQVAGLNPDPLRRAGDTVDYRFLVTSTGTRSLSQVRIDDNRCAVAPSYVSGDSGDDGWLVAGETWVFACSHTVTQDEADAGGVVNSATAGAADSRGQAITSAADTTSVPIGSAAGIGLVKEYAGSTPDVVTAAGQILYYRFTATNTGNVSLSSITINDNRCSTTPTLLSGDEDGDSRIAPGEVWVLRCLHRVTQEELDAGRVVNSATVTATPPGGTSVTSSPPQVVTTSVRGASGLTLSKAVADTDPDTITSHGQRITYRFTVLNSGTVSVRDPEVDDDRCDAPPALTSGGASDADLLGPGDTWVFSCEHTTTQAEVDAGRVDNVATASGTRADDGEPVTSAEATSTLQIEPEGGIGARKSVDPASVTPVRAGDQVVWNVLVYNTGNVSLSDVTVTDAQCDLGTLAYVSGDDDADNELDPGTPDEGWTFRCSHTVTQAEVDGRVAANTAQVSGVRPDASTTTSVASASVTIAPTSGLTVDKQTGTPGPSPIPSAGDTIAYNFVVANTGSTTLRGVRVADGGPAVCNAPPALTSGDFNGDGLLQPTEGWTFSCSHTLTQAELDAGTLDNTAAVSGTPAGSTTAITSDPDTVTIPLGASPSLTLDKQVAGTTPTQLSAAGQRIDYRFVLTNGGNRSVTAVVVNDARCSTAVTLVSGDANGDANLQPNETWTLTCAHVVTQAEVDAREVVNTATATGMAAGMTEPILSAPASTRTAVNPVARLAVDKQVAGSAPNPLTGVGDRIDYAFIVTNPGTVSVAAPAITDARCDSGTLSGVDGGDVNGDGQVNPGESWRFVCSHRVTQAEADAGRVDNTATVSGTPAGQSTPISSAPDTTSTTIDPTGGLSITKTVAGTVPSPLTAVGQSVDYRFTVDNTSNRTIASVSVDDDRCRATATLESGDANNDGLLQPSETWILACTHTLTQDEVDERRVQNTAGASGTFPDGTTATALPASAEVGVSPSYELALYKAVDSTSPSPLQGVGNVIAYRFTVTAPGSGSVVAPTIADDRCSTPPAFLGGDTDGDEVLNPTETWTFTCNHTVTQDEADAGRVDNAATASGTGTDGSAVRSPVSTTSTPIARTGGLALDKRVRGTSADPLTRAGDTVDYALDVDNTSNVTLRDVAVTDALCDAAAELASGDADGDGRLQPTETWTFTCRHTVTQDEVDAGLVHNVGTVTARNPDDSAAAPATDSVDSEVRGSTNVVLDKRLVSGAPATVAGAVLGYEFVVTNPGTASLTDVAISDDRCDSTPKVVGGDADGLLAPTETWTYTCSHTVTQAEVDAGSVTNTATAAVVSSTGATDVSPADTVTVPIVRTGGLTMLKTVLGEPELTAAGQQVEYRLQVSNASNVTVTSVAVTDAKCSPVLTGGDEGADGAMAPGEVWVYSCVHTVTQAEVDQRAVANTAQAAGVNPDASPATSNPSSVEVGVAPTSGLRLDKVVRGTDPNPLVKAGGRIDYGFTVTNPGTASVLDPVVQDDRCDAAPRLESGDANGDGRLQPTETWVFACAHTVRQSEIDTGAVVNVATVSGTAAGSTDVVQSAPDSTRTPVDQAGYLTMTKQVVGNPALTGAGQQITYRFIGSNFTNRTISEVHIIDPICDARAVYESGDLNNDLLLQPDETWIGTCTHTVTQAEVDAKQVVNTAGATGIWPDGSGATSAADTVAHPITPSYALAVDKTISSTDPATITGVGQLVNYRFEVSNPGTGSLTGIAINDGRCDGDAVLVSGDVNNDGLIQPSENWVFACSHRTTQADIDSGSVSNTATVSGAPASGTPVVTSPGDGVELPVGATGALSIAKSVRGTDPAELSAVGQKVTYDFEVTSDANVSILSPAIVDARCDAPAAYQSGDANGDGRLNDGRAWRFSCVHTVTQAEVDAGVVQNSATATGRYPDGTAVSSAPDEAQVEVVPTSEVVIDKQVANTIPATPGRVGDVVSYRFVVTNNGTSTLSAPAVDDDQCASPAVFSTGDDGADGVLSPGEDWVFVCDHLITQAEVDARVVINTATASAAPPRGDRVVSRPDSTETDLVPSTGIVVEKAADPDAAPARVGDPVGYTFTVTNSGSASLRDVTIDDPQCVVSGTPTAGDTSGDGLLQPTETWVFRCTHTVTQDEVDAGRVTNIATASGTPTGATTPIVSSPSRVTVEIAEQGGIAIAKAAVGDPAPAAAGDTVAYRLSVTSTANVSLGDVRVTDGRCTSVGGAPAIVGPSGDADGDNRLDPSETWVYDCTHVLTQAEVDAGEVENVASVEATTPGGTAVDDDSPRVVVAVEPTTGIAVDKTVASLSPSPIAAQGDVVSYELAVSTGGASASLREVRLTDTRCDAAPELVRGDDGDGLLQPTETWVYACDHTVTQAEVNAGTVQNTGTAVGTPTSTDAQLEASDSTEVPIERNPQLTIDKRIVGEPTITAAGQRLDYDIVIANPGNVSLTAVALEDRLCEPSLVAGDAAPLGRLDPGESWVYTCGYTVTQADVDAGGVVNTASVTADSPSGPLADPPSDSVRVDIAPEAEIRLNKYVPAGQEITAAGQRLRYEFRVRNPGNVTLRGVTVSDAQCEAAPAVIAGDEAPVGTLDPGETWTLDCTHVVTQQEVDEGNVHNEARVTATPPQVSDDADPVDTSVGRTPGLALIKALRDGQPELTAAGQRVGYTFTVTNTGNVTIDDPSVADARCDVPPTLVGAAPATLLPGDARQFECEHTITQDEVDAGVVLNRAVASGSALGFDDPIDSPVEELKTPVRPNAAVSIVKSVPADQPAVTAAGAELRYEFRVRNDGNVTLSDVAVTDAQCTTAPRRVGGDTSPLGRLQPGETWTFACAHVVTQEELDAGRVVNVASVSGQPPTPADAPAPAPIGADSNGVVTPIEANPGLTLDKEITGRTPSPLTGAGDEVEYTFTLANSGNVTLSDVALVDERCTRGPSAPTGDTNNDGRLDVGETWRYDCVHVVTQDEADAQQVRNEARASALAPGATTRTESVDRADTPVEADAEWTIDKSVPEPRTISVAGDVIDYRIVLANTGRRSLDDVELTDERCDAEPKLVSGDAAPTGRLDVGESWVFECTHTVTQAEVDAGRVVNVASATAKATGGAPDAITDSHTSDVAAAPGLDLVKRVRDGAEPRRAGDRIRYAFDVRNTGNVTLGDIVIDDALCDVAATVDSGDADRDGRLDVGETWTLECVHTLTQAEVDAGRVVNVATARGTGPTPDGGVEPAPVTSEPSRTDTEVPAEPALSLAKSVVDDQPAVTAAGQPIGYRFTVRNPGNVTMSEVVINDALCDAAATLERGDVDDDGRLDRGETWTFACVHSVTQAEIDAGRVVNTATASGTGPTPDGSPAPSPVTSPADTTTTPVAGASGLSLDKQFVGASASPISAAGDVVSYRFVVANTGQRTLSNVALEDSRCDSAAELISGDAGVAGALEVGETWTLTCEHTLTQAEVDSGSVVNTATVTAEDPAGEPVAPVSDGVELPVSGEPLMTIDKQVVGEPEVTGAGQVLNYRIVVTNPGTVSLREVRVVDDRCDADPTVTGDAGVAGTLEVGETWTLECAHTLTQAEVDSGHVVNVASASASLPDGTRTPTVTDATDTAVAARPAIVVDKQVVAGAAPVAAGDTVDYRFVVTNPGNVSLAGVRIDDALCDAPATPASGQDGRLGPGESWTFGCTHTLTQAEADAGNVHNVATASGTPPTPDGGATPPPVTSAPDSTDTEVSATAAIELEKRASEVVDVDANGHDVGDRIDYRFVVANRGTASANDLVVDDPMLGGPIACPATSLAPGQSMTCGPVRYVLTAADVERGRVVNAASVTASAGPGVVRAEDSVRTALVPGGTDGQGPGDPDGPGPDGPGGQDPGVPGRPTLPWPDGSLAATGGPAIGIGIVGLIAAAGGLWLLVRRRRRDDSADRDR